MVLLVPDILNAKAFVSFFYSTGCCFNLDDDTKTKLFALHDFSMKFCDADEDM
jgi:hypothetical protein